ncbi:hypothetical protein FHG66_10255 [Rubellimicrobium rubrum]|uniref:Uncharacterized protein n=1 Tax=Rubellimicrobium rubrum TaxID=2585369 RepID=A0A5C4MWW1_9RHOB|nr:hypothetical protein [Rubellimicrobium rubrum]TNC49885.1 hypothetical protein FHG66_10255 [Rubellimicrobium rubrum]
MADLIERLGLSGPGQAFILFGATAVFLAAPDIDLMLLRLLHHRSILTHSVLLPFLVLWFLPALGPAAAAGAFLGVAIHLSADLLSPARGYGQIYLPEPFQVGLGGWSHVWLLLNALAAAWLAVAILPVGEGWRLLAAGTGVVAALCYGLGNERSIMAVIVALAVVGAGQYAYLWLQPH